MNEVEDVRRKNLLRIKERLGVEWQELAKTVEWAPSYMSQVMSGKRPFTESKARHVELKLGRKPHSLDSLGAADSEPVNRVEDNSLFERVVALVEDALRGIAKPSNRQFAEVVTLVHDDARERGVSELFVQRLVGFLKRIKYFEG